MAREDVPMTTSARDSLIAIACLWVLFGIVVGFRLLGRIRGIGIGPDDIFSLSAFILAGSTVGMNAAVFASGVGYDFDPESPLYETLAYNMEFLLQVTFAFTLIYLWTLAALKLSQLCFYHRAFGVQLKFWIYGAGAIIVAWAIIFTFVFIFLCDPVEQQWTIDRIGHCKDQILVLKCIIMTNVLTDIMIIVLPISTVWALQMRKTEKFAILSCFALGIACVVIGIVRFWQIFVVDLIGNLTGTSLMTFMLCTIELMLAGLCINIPMLRPFYLRWRQKSKLSQSSRTEGTHGLGNESGLGNIVSARGKSQNEHNTWIELETNSNDDGSSERKLTREQDPGIYVSTNWTVSHS